MEMSTGVSLLRTAQSLLTGRTILRSNFWYCRLSKTHVKTIAQMVVILHFKTFLLIYMQVEDTKVSKVAKIRNRCNQVTHPTQDTNGKVTN